MGKVATLILFLCATLLAHAQADFTLLAIEPRVSGGGGSPTWYDSIALGSTTDDLNQNDNGWLWASAVVVGQTGNATKLRVRILNADFDPPIKIALYDASSNLLTSVTSTLSDALVPYDKEVTITSTAVTSGATYLVAVHANSNGSEAQYRRGNTSGKSYVHFVSFGSGPPATFSEGFAPAGPVFVSIYVE